jgi:hypothetical protein
MLKTECIKRVSSAKSGSWNVEKCKAFLLANVGGGSNLNNALRNFRRGHVLTHKPRCFPWTRPFWDPDAEMGNFLLRPKEKS